LLHQFLIFGDGVLSEILIHELIIEFVGVFPHQIIVWSLAMGLYNIAFLRTCVVSYAVLRHLVEALPDVGFVVYCCVFVIDKPPSWGVVGFVSFFLVVFFDSVIEDLTVLRLSEIL